MIDSNTKHLNNHTTGQVTATFGRQCTVETKDNKSLSCVTRGKKTGIVCGDWVAIQHTAEGQGVIEKIKPRSSLLYRSDAYRKKIIAANVTQIIIVVAAIPSFSEELINRCLVAAEDQHINVLIVLNKADLTEPTKIALETLSLYQQLGYQLLSLSAKHDLSVLLPYLDNHLSVLAGQSGMGKSTLINALIPKAKRATAEISTALDSGSHTTTHSQLYSLNSNSKIIDSPGIQEFGLHHITAEDLAWRFREFNPFIGKCKFHNCRHVNEPNCAILNAVDEEKINVRRINYYHRILPIQC